MTRSPIELLWPAKNPTEWQHAAKDQKKEGRFQTENGAEKEGEKGESCPKGKEQEGEGRSSAEEGREADEKSTEDLGLVQEARR